MLAFKASNRTWSTATLSVVYNCLFMRAGSGLLCPHVNLIFGAILMNSRLALARALILQAVARQRCFAVWPI